MLLAKCSKLCFGEYTLQKRPHLIVDNLLPILALASDNLSQIGISMASLCGRSDILSRFHRDRLIDKLNCSIVSTRFQGGMLETYRNCFTSRRLPKYLIFLIFAATEDLEIFQT